MRRQLYLGFISLEEAREIEKREMGRRGSIEDKDYIVWSHGEKDLLEGGSLNAERVMESALMDENWADEGI